MQSRAGFVTMRAMDAAYGTWAFVISLAAVVNGLGIVRMVGGFSDYLRKRTSVTVTPYWVYTVMAMFQLLAHTLLWWSILGLRNADGLNFLSYLYLLLGPTLLFLATNMLSPDVSQDTIDLRRDYYEVRRVFYGILAAFWAWAVFIWPVFGYPFAPTVPVLLVWFVLAVAAWLFDQPRVQAVLAVAHLAVFAGFVARYAMNLGEVGRGMIQ